MLLAFPCFRKQLKAFHPSFYSKNFRYQTRTKSEMFQNEVGTEMAVREVPQESPKFFDLLRKNVTKTRNIRH